MHCDSAERRQFRRLPYLAVILAVLLAPLTFRASAIEAASSGTGFGLLDSREKGVLNVGHSRAEMSRVPASEGEGEAVKLDFSMDRGSAAGIWTKQFPPGLARGSVDILTVRARTAQPLSPIRAKLEIKGSAGVQTVPVELSVDWIANRRQVEWGQIGTLSEVVFLVEPAGDAPAVSGTVYLECRFGRLPMLEAVGLSRYGRLGEVVPIALLAALLAGIGRLASSGLGRGWKRKASETLEVVRSPKGVWALLRDVALGTAAVLTAGMALATGWLGATNTLDSGYVFLGVAIAGGLVGQFWKFAATGRMLTATEAFCDVLATGLLAASSSGQSVWQAPAAWPDLLALSATGATVFLLLYHLANAYLLTTARRHLSLAAGAVIVVTPYAFGLLLALESANLAGAIGNFAACGWLGDRPELAVTIGRVLLLFGFNEFVIGAVCLISAARLLRSVRAHLNLLVVAAAAIAAPWVADLGSGAVTVPVAFRPLAALVATMLSQGALWALVFMLTGVVLDGMRRQPPSAGSIRQHGMSGLRKGMAFSGILVSILFLFNALVHWPIAIEAYRAAPWLVLASGIAAAFPLAKTIIESFDGSQSFFRRAGRAYGMPLLYVRGIVVGLGAWYALGTDFFALPTARRVELGFVVGALAYAGVSLVGDAVLAWRDRGRVRPWRPYLVEALLGGFVGAGLGFYLDSSQVPVVLEKFKLYNSYGLKPVSDDFYPLLSKWGRIQLSPYAGGAKLLFNEALKGVIGWGVAAWLFALNRSLLLAIFQREIAPLRRIFSRDGMAELTDGTIHVLRWGLWMAPIIFTFLRQMPTPTWYNQDGAIHTGFCIVNSFAMDPRQFHDWSLRVFTWVLGYDFFRILIWLDHMGLRVATLVNLSFLGMDRLDEKAARFVRPWATARCIPEGIKRFTTWAPLLIPFYIPVGAEWDWAWTHSEAIQASSPGALHAILGMPGAELAWLTVAAIASISLVSFAVRRTAAASGNAGDSAEQTLSNARYAVTAKASGELGSRLAAQGYDVTRRSYEGIDPAGRVLFLAESQLAQPAAWPVVGNYPDELFAASRIEGDGRAIRITNQSHDVCATVTIRLADDAGDVAAEIWEITLENLSDRARVLNVVPYLEWVLATPTADRGHTQYNRLFPEVSYEPELNAVLALHRLTKKLGMLAADRPPRGFLTSRVDFIGRAGSVWSPGCLEGPLDEKSFIEPQRAEACPMFDPIGSLLVEIPLDARGSGSLRLLIGCADNKEQAANWVRRYLKPSVAAASHASTPRPLRIGHGRIPPGTPQPYCEFTDGGRSLRVHTPFTPRAFDHAMSNALGHVLTVTNRGLHSSASVNAQQNRITTDWADTATRELPSEAFYLYDLDDGQWYSPTYLPLRDKHAAYSVEFGVDGTATFRMERPEIVTELTTFVPPQEPTGVYLLTVTNRGSRPRRLRLASYFEIVLADNPENAGPLVVDYDRVSGGLFFENRRNTFRSGPAFAAMSSAVEVVVTRRGDFFGQGRSVAHPALVEDGHPPDQRSDDRQPVAGLATTLELAAGGSATVAVVLGQADDRRQAEAVIAKFHDVAAATASLAETRAWWNGLMNTLEIRTSEGAFDGYLRWLEYQALVERIWARKGFYQASGAFGFRDQLQDAVNLIWLDPVLARRQILLHAAQQFLEGDVVHWFFRLQDGRTGFVARSHASDNPLWLAWAAVEYVRMTGDRSIWDQRVWYLTAETPLAPLPQGKEGMGFFPYRSDVEEPLWDHVFRAVDLVLDHRMGAHGLPLIGTGDWNDGLDEIGSQGRGESVWLGLFLYSILDQLVVQIERKKDQRRRADYQAKMVALREALEGTWRGDRYLRAIHDDGTEIGIAGSGIWEIDALTAAWAVIAGINAERGRIVFDTAIRTLERDKVILLGWPALREDSKPYLGRSCRYPEGVRENGMYSHGVQWLIKAARLLSERFGEEGDHQAAKFYRDTTIRLWRKISPLAHTTAEEMEIYGGQPNKQAADILTAFEPGRMIWNGYTGAAAWMLREACEGVIGARLVDNRVILPTDLEEPRGDLRVHGISRRLEESPLREMKS